MPRVEKAPLVALVPIKGAGNKSRLASVLSAPQRQRLSRWMLARTLSALAGVPDVGHVRLIGHAGDTASQQLARARQIAFVCETAADLNQALQAEVDRCLAQAQRVLILFSDLPLLTPTALESLLDASTATLTLAPDTHHRGTNALLYRGSVPFTMVYGPNSFSRYLEQARRQKITSTEFFDERLAWDLDTPEDWAHLVSRLQALGAPVEVASAT